MKVKEYLVGRILYLESDLKRVQNEKAGTTYGLQKLQEEVIKLNEKIEQYEIEREHIKEIITCNISNGEIKIVYPQCDYETLLAILDIKPEDYDVEEDIDNNCDRCLFADVDGDKLPCNKCNDGSEFIDKEVTPDAKNTD